MFRDIVSMMENGEVPVNYRDPQEFIYREKRTPESDVYSVCIFLKKYAVRIILNTAEFQRMNVL